RLRPAWTGGGIGVSAGSLAHKADVGGAVAGSTSADATEMFHEGLLVPPIKIVDADVAQIDVERIILTNSRQPVLVRGDIHAQIAVTKMGAQRVKQLCERFGASTVSDAFAAILKGAADELRVAIAKLPEGESSAEGLLDSDGVVIDKPVKLAVSVAIKNGLANFDFSNSDPQARGPVNLRPSMVEACVFYSLIGCLGPNLHFNDGMREVVRLKFAPRTVTNAEQPAPVSNYQMVNLKLVDVILEALGRFHPDRAIANAGSSSALTIAWANGRAGHSTMQYEIMGSAYGGGMSYDGASATATHLSNLHITPIEILESEFPCRITRFELVADSGGAGRWRGGLSLLREYELLENATVIRLYDKSRFPPAGMAGGHAGCGARFVIRLGTAQEHATPSSGRYEMQAGERFLLQSAGGGGYGDPPERDAAALSPGIGEGSVSADGAKKDYGT